MKQALPRIKNKKALSISREAIVLLSGGLDSTTTLYLARSKGYKCLCLIFDYGQRHNKEIISAKRIAKLTHSPYEIIRFRLPWKGSSLLDKTRSIPKFVKKRKMIPSTYVPGRNLIFLSLAVSFAESIGSEAIFIGANAVDFSGYPDCRPQFYEALRKTAKLGTKRGSEGKTIKIYTPLIRKSKSEIVKLGFKLGVPFKYTWSCYRGGRKPCGVCDSCKLREKGFRNAGIKDPLLVGSS